MGVLYLVFVDLGDTAEGVMMEGMALAVFF